MWISKKKYEQMQLELRVAQSDKAMAEAKYKAITENQITATGGIIILSSEAFNLLCSTNSDSEREVNDLKLELSVLKQKYADEVQKRFELIEQIKKGHFEDIEKKE